MSPDKTSPIIILGAGAWGLSTALHLYRQNYTNITVFERAEQIPSPYSAAYDLNKIVRAEYEDPFYTELALEAIKAWKTPLFGPHFHQTGYINCATGRAPPKASAYLDKALASVSSHPIFGPHVRSLNSSEEMRDVAWQFTGPLTGFRGYHNTLAGYAHSSDAMKGVWTYLAARGIKFVLGEEKGRVCEIVYDSTSSSASSSTSSSENDNERRCTGIITADGTHHTASTIIIALGAWAGTLIPEIGHSVVARSWSVAHIQLTKSECDYLRFIPTTNIRDLGFFFEPDPETRLFKICPLGAGYTNPVDISTLSTSKSSASAATTAAAASGRRKEENKPTRISLPPSATLPAPQDFIPLSDERKLRLLLRETLPWLADRPFVEKRLCWFADTADSEYCIDFVPHTNKSVVVLSGDSGHGFKMMPVFGSWVVKLLERGRQEEGRWGWRYPHPEKTEVWGDEVSWRIGVSRELKELVEEKERLDRAASRL